MSWRHHGLIVLLPLVGACDDSDAKMKERREAERAAVEQARTASQARSAVLQATRAVHERAAAEAGQRVGTTRLERPHGAAATEDLEAACRQATEALERARLDLHQSLEDQIDALDDRAQRLRDRLEGTPDARTRGMKDAATKIERGARDLRQDLQEFESATVASIEQFQVRLQQNLTLLQRMLKELEDEV